ncbi:MAG: hypothetical protein NTY19_14480 [Planctomycetota bacterium]|nr:hypothetical protein [Planctomycetota bacterium]
MHVIPQGTDMEVPAACRTEFNVPQNRQELCLTWSSSASPTLSVMPASLFR